MQERPPRAAPRIAIPCLIHGGKLTTLFEGRQSTFILLPPMD